MRERTFVVHGVVTDAVHGKGIHGINVRLTDKKRLLDKLGASTLCHSDGRFTLRFDRKSQAILFRTKPTFRVQFFDRDGVLLHEEPARVRFAAASNMSIKVAIPNLKIANHLSRPLTLQQRSGRLVPDGRVGIFAHAFARLPNLASARYANFLSDRPCPFPPLDRFDDLLEDIWGTLGGDPFARDRFEDVIDVFAAGNLPRRESISTTARDLRVTARAGADSRKTLDRLIVELKATAPMWAPAEALLGRDALVPLMLATAWTFGADGQRLDSSLRTVLGQLAAYRPLAALLSAAEQSLGGGQKSERHLQAIMGTLDELCGFEAGLPPPFEGLLIDPSDLGALEHWGCTAEAAMAIRFLRDRVGFPPRPGTSTETYRIDSMSPSPVCGGDEITLTGEGFTGVPGLVRFAGERARRRMPIGVEAISWSDTEIRVTIPPEAACGPIELRIVEDRVTVSVCDAFLDFSTYRSAESEFLFSGCRPQISYFGLADRDDCATIGSSSEIAWRVDPESAETTLTVREGDGTPVTVSTDGSSLGSAPIDTSRITTFTWTLTASNSESSCDSATATLTLSVGPPPPVLTIPGVELTQGIQRFSLDDPTVANNSVTMIAQMDTVIRAFVASDRGDGFAPDARVTGRLYCAGQLYTPINGVPRGTALIIVAGASPQRNQINHSINFLIPAARANGSAVIDIEVFAADRCDGMVSAMMSMPINWEVRDPFPVTILRIAEPGSGNVFSEDAAITIVDNAFDRLPSPRSEIRLRSDVFAINESTTEANYCTDGGFYQLALSVAYEHNAVEGLWPNPHESAWIGLFFRGDCTQDGMMSWPWTSTCISERNIGVVAHELAHITGMGHTVTSVGERCDDIWQPVACHTLPNDGIFQDIVFDIRNNELIVGAADLMSYHLEPRFPHPDHWERIRRNMDGRF